MRRDEGVRITAKPNIAPRLGKVSIGAVQAVGTGLGGDGPVCQSAWKRGLFRESGGPWGGHAA